MIAVLHKLVDLRVEIDPLTGEPAVVTGGEPDRAFGASPADLAALEAALQLAEPGEEIVVAAAAPPVSHATCDAMLRAALAAGATRAIRIEIVPGSGSAEVAAMLAPVVKGARYVLCGDASLDRGSGSVPAFVAAILGAAQALGLTSITAEGAALLLERRLDGGRREQLRIHAPAVLSLQAGLRLRRASLAGAAGGARGGDRGRAPARRWPRRDPRAAAPVPGPRGCAGAAFRRGSARPGAGPVRHARAGPGPPRGRGRRRDVRRRAARLPVRARLPVTCW